LHDLAIALTALTLRDALYYGFGIMTSQGNFSSVPKFRTIILVPLAGIKIPSGVSNDRQLDSVFLDMNPNLVILMMRRK
jgi:hypothetical protein